MRKFSFPWYSDSDAEFQVCCSVSKWRAATTEEPEEYPEISVESVQPGVGMELAPDILDLLDESVLCKIEVQAELYVEEADEDDYE